jgi:beta-phosphoglucomutase-like phosphatase (HAD superfamily)
VELEVERDVLVPNRLLVRWLKLQRSRYIPVIAISDTSLPVAAIQSLIEAVAGPNVVDRIYTSADLGLSKRNGGIFTEVAAREKTDVHELIHFGDDRRADVEQGLAAGIQCTHLRRTLLFVMCRKLDGLLFEAGRLPSRSLRNAGKQGLYFLNPAMLLVAQFWDRLSSDTVWDFGFTFLLQTNLAATASPCFAPEEV